MPINVFPWPPVGVVGSEWTEDAPVARLRSAMTGRDQRQSSRPVRRLATLTVSALANGQMGAGYCEMLKSLLRGGIHAVRLQSSPINWWVDEQRRRGADLNAPPMVWRVQGSTDPLTWRTEAAQPLRWFSGIVVRGGVPSAHPFGGYLPAWGLPPQTLVGRPGDFIRIHDLASDASEVARLMRPAMTNAAGEVTLKLDRMPTIQNGRISMSGQDEGVFQVDGPLPRAVQPIAGDWQYTWSFREVFAEEVGGFTERPSVWT